MFVPVTITANGDAIYQAGFDSLGRDVEDMTVPLSAIGSRLVEDVGAQFGTEGGWSGYPWAELSPTYGAWKARRGPGVPILVGLRPEHKGTRQHPTRPQHYVMSGKMRGELLDMAAVRVTPKRMAYLPTSDIAGFHQEGTERMPARPPVSLPLTELHEWDRIWVRWLNGLLQASLSM